MKYVCQRCRGFKKIQTLSPWYIEKGGVQEKKLLNIPCPDCKGKGGFDEMFVLDITDSKNIKVNNMPIHHFDFLCIEPYEKKETRGYNKNNNLIFYAVSGQIFLKK